MPDPTTVASSNAAPSASAARRRESGGVTSVPRLRGCAVHPPDLFQPRLQAELVEAANRQRCKHRDALTQHAVCVLERERDLGRVALRFRRIGDAPMRGHRLARPHRAGFTRGVVADGEHEIERRRAGLCELAPRLGAEVRRVVTEAVKQRDSVRVDVALRLAPGGIGAEPVRAELVENGFGDDRARRIASAKKKRVERPVTHDLSRTAGRRCSASVNQASARSTLLHVRSARPSECWCRSAWPRQWCGTSPTKFRRDR